VSQYAGLEEYLDASGSRKKHKFLAGEAHQVLRLAYIRAMPAPVT
jgi:hypothetical protein